MKLVYCAAGNQRFAQIAIDAGYCYGAQLPGTIYRRPWFVDQNWKNPDRTAYMTALAEHKPHMASVLDLEQESQLDEVLGWAEEAAQYVERVVIIPKVFGIVRRLPRRINGRDVVLGFSVPTKYGGTELPIWEFAGWPVHLLGGSPHRQIKMWRQMVCIADVVSADGNYSNLKATKFCEYWIAPGRWLPIRPKQEDAPYEAFARSCANIMAAWQRIAGRVKDNGHSTAANNRGGQGAARDALWPEHI